MKKNRIQRGLFFLSLICSLATLGHDILHGKVFQIGPIQIAGIILSLCLLAAALLLQNDHHKTSWRLAVFFLPLAPFFFWIWRNYLSLDLWFDEVYTLDHFVFTPLNITLTDYRSTNNHIFFNILNSLYLKALGIHSFTEILPHVEILRGLMFFYAGATLYGLFSTTRKYFNIHTALIAAIILATSIPFYNFAVQIRGYTLSMLLLCLLVATLWEMGNEPAWKTAFKIIILVTLLLYTLPTNIYVILTIFFMYLIIGSNQFIKNVTSEKGKIGRNRLSIEKLWILLSNNPSLLIVLTIITAAFPVVLLYIPVLNPLINNPNTYIGIFNFRILYPLMGNVLSDFLAGRWFLLLPLLWGSGLMLIEFKKNRPGSTTNQYRHFLFIVGLLFMPFFMAFIHGYIAFDRIFLILAPIFSLALAIPAGYLITHYPILQKKTWLVLLLLALYSYASFWSDLQGRDERILADIRNGSISQTLTDNYYQAYYQPQVILKYYIDRFQLNTVPLFVYNWGDISAIPVYTTFLDLAPQKIETSDQMVSKAYSKAHVITAYPNTFLRETAKNSPEVSCQRLNPELSFINLFECSW